MSRTTRRFFFQSSFALGASAGLSVAAKRILAQSPNNKLNLAIVGAGNKGWHNVQQLRSQNVVVLCDVDSNYVGRAANDFPKASQYRDYRRMLDAEHQGIDAVVVSTADHTHAPATIRAIALGKHVYCEKPLAHSVWETREVAEAAARNKVATQMGTQIHAGSNYRRVVEIIQSGAIGPVTAAYSWCNKDWSGGRFAKSSGPAPSHLDWDLWLGPAEKRRYSRGVHPSNWRRFWEYGSGTFGDMACHVVDLPFWALNLDRPVRVRATGSPVDEVGTAKWAKAEYDFPARSGRPPLTLYWSDGNAHFDLVKQTKDRAGRELSRRGLGTLFVGSKGMLFADYGSYQLLPEKNFESFKPPEPSIADSIGHWNEWVEACKDGRPTTCNFSYSGALTETVLLGIVAYRSGKEFEWDGDNLVAKQCPAANDLVHKEYRRGWEVAGIA